MMKNAIMSLGIILSLSLNNVFAQGDNTAEAAVDFSRISTTILAHKDLIQSSANQEVTVFLGYTGSGKSTLINYLAQRDLEVLPDGDIQLVKKEDTTSMKIGETGESQTRYPQSVCVKVANHSHVLYDLPGFGDTSKDINTQLVNAAFIKHILANAQKVRIVFVTSHSDFDGGRAKLLSELLNIARKIFPESAHEEMIAASLLVVTKSTQPTRESAVDFLLKKCRAEDKPLLGELKKQEKIYHMQKSRLVSEERDHILSALDGLSAHKPAVVDISVVYPGEVQRKLSDIFLSLINREFERAYREGQEAESFAKLQECINEYSSDGFWQNFNEKVVNLKEIQVLKDLCQATYKNAVQNFQGKNATTPNTYVAALRNRETKLIDAVKAKCEIRMKKIVKQRLDAKRVELCFNIPTVMLRIDAATEQLTLQNNVVADTFAREIAEHIANDSEIRELRTVEDQRISIVDGYLQEFLNSSDCRNSCTELQQQVNDRREQLSAHITMLEAQQAANVAALRTEMTERITSDLRTAHEHETSQLNAAYTGEIQRVRDGHANEQRLIEERMRTAQAEKRAAEAEKGAALERLSSQTDTLTQLDHYARATEPLVTLLAEKYLEENKKWLMRAAYERSVDDVTSFRNMLEANLGDQSLSFPCYSQYPLSRTMRHAQKVQTINMAVITKFCNQGIGGQAGFTRELKYLKHGMYVRRGIVGLGIAGTIGSFGWLFTK